MTRDEAIKYMMEVPGRKAKPTSVLQGECYYDPDGLNPFMYQCGGYLEPVNSLWYLKDWEPVLFIPKNVDLFDPERCRLDGPEDCAVHFNYDNPETTGKCKGQRCETCICAFCNRLYLRTYIEKRGGQRVPNVRFLK